jgi:hypothetical protein
LIRNSNALSDYGINNHVFVIVDDFLDYVSFDNYVFRDLIINHNFYKISVIFNLSYSYKPLFINNHIDYVFVGPEYNKHYQLFLYFDFFRMHFHQFNDFTQLLDKCTTDNNFLVLADYQQKSKIYWVNPELYEYKIMRNLLYYHRIKETYIVRELI